MKEVADAVCPSRTLSRTRSSLTLMHLRRTIALSSQTSSSSPASVLSMWSYSLHLILLSQITPTAAWPVLSLRSPLILVGLSHARHYHATRRRIRPSWLAWPSRSCGMCSHILLHLVAEMLAGMGVTSQTMAQSPTATLSKVPSPRNSPRCRSLC
jgi:hypothetical protein